MLRKLLYSLQGRLKTRQIAHNGEPYMERSLVGTLFGVRLYLHRFVASDSDGIHDHPFLYSVSVILAGWYWEDRWARRYLRRWVNFIGPNDMHRVVLPTNGRDVWTLFMHSARVKPWGFFRAVALEAKGPRFEYKAVSDADDPAYSDWSKDLTGAQLRAQGSMFPIPMGQNAYQVGLLPYPQSALTHSVEHIVDTSATAVHSM